jgi:hypothetical protein
MKSPDYTLRTCKSGVNYVWCDKCQKYVDPVWHDHCDQEEGNEIKTYFAEFANGRGYEFDAENDNEAMSIATKEAEENENTLLSVLEIADDFDRLIYRR